MFPLPELPLVPKLQRFFEPEQARTFMMVFGIALLAQWFIPWSGPAWSWDMFGATLWPLIAGIGFVVLTFVPGLAQNLPPNLLFVIVAGVGAVGTFWSFATAGGPFFWGWGFGTIGVATTCAGCFLWARNGYQQLYWTLVLSGLIALVLGLLIPMGGGLPLVRIFTSIGDPFPHIVARIFGTIFALGYIFLIVLVVMNVFLKKEEADQEQVARHGTLMFVAALALPLVYGLIGFTIFATMLHFVLVGGIFMWLLIWGMVCVFEAKARGENLFSFG